MAKQTTGQQAQKERIARTENYAQKVKQEYASAVNDILALYKQLPKLNTGEMYSFDAQNSKLRTQASQVIRRLHANTLSTIHAGVSQEWEKANKAMDKLISNAVGREALKDERLAGWFDRNEKALKAFMNRSDYGMNLSDRVWKNTQQFRDELEVALTVAIGEGKSASSMSRKVRQYLNDPDLMFKRFHYKDENGNWKTKWKKKVVDTDGKYHFIDYDRDSYKTGPGVYKSAYKNSMRLTRTETNMAYRMADHDRWQGLDFVLGQKIETSGSHTKEDLDICDELAGEYPKDFKFDGWHPQCYCICTPILTSEEDMEAEMQAALEGKPYTPKRKPITKYPKGFKDFLTNNKSALQKAISQGKAPYFIKNNMAVAEAIFSGEEPPVTIAVETAPLQEPKEKPFKPLSLKGLKKIFDVEGNEDKFEGSFMQGMDFTAVKDGLNDIAAKNGFKLKSFLLDVVSKDTFSLRVRGEKGSFNLVRTFTKNPDGTITVDHDYFTLAKEYQGKGVSKDVFKLLYGEYRRIGVDEIQVCANIDVGGYTWARYGFQATREDALKVINLKADTALRTEGQAIVAEFYKNRSEDTLFPMNLLVSKLGVDKAKQLLKGRSWEGKLNLKDSAQREVFEKYMGYSPKPAQPQAQPQPKEKPFKPLSLKELEQVFDVYGDKDKYEGSFMQNMDYKGLKESIGELMGEHGLNMRVSSVTITGDSSFSFSFIDKKGKFTLVRSFSKNSSGKITVTHDYFSLSKDFQGKGISKNVFNRLYTEYERMGVNEIKVHANIDVGGYTWARYGFSATKKGALKAVDNYKADAALRKEGKAIIDEYYKDKSDAKHFPMNLLVEKLGKEKAKLLLKGSDWHGTLNLENSSQRQMFEKYIGYDKAQTTAPKPSQPTKEERRQAILLKAQERHDARTPEQEKAIKDAWKKRQEKHAAIQQDAKSTLSLASEYKEISSDTLQKLIKDNNLTKLPAATKKVQEAIAESKKAEEALSDLIPDVHSWHKEFTIDELKATHESVKKKLDYLAKLPLEKQLSKLKFEVEEYLGKNQNGVQNKYPTWKVSQEAYKKKMSEVDLKIKYNELEKGLQEIDVYLQAHPKATKMVEQHKLIQDWLDNDVDYNDIKKEFDILNDTYKRRVASEKSRAKKKTVSTFGTGPFTSDAYTKERKDKALWDTSPDKKKSLDTLHPEACKAWQAASEAEKDAAYEYTMTYCWTNEPLQGRKYTGGNKQTRAQFEERVKNIEKYVDRNELPCDMWFQRGDRDLNVVASRLKFRDPKAVMPSDIQALVGMEIQEGGFMSSASSRGSGFNKRVIFNIYAPKGTKAAYVEPFSYYGKGGHRAWDGKSKQTRVGGENETLFQRGTIMRITKVVEKFGIYYIDVDVIGQEQRDLSYVRTSDI